MTAIAEKGIALLNSCDDRLKNIEANIAELKDQMLLSNTEIDGNEHEHDHGNNNSI